MNNSISDNYLIREQVDVLFKASFTGGLLNIFASWLIFFLIRDTDIETSALILCAAITVIVLVRSLITNSYLTKKKFSLSIYLNSYLFLTMCIGTAWALFQYNQASHEGEAIRNIIFLINFGLIAGGIAILSVWLPAYLAYIFPQSAAIFAVFISLDSVDKYYIAFTFFIFIAVMMSTSFNVNRRYRREIELTHNNKKLITDLNIEICNREEIQLELEDNKADLEDRIKDRTRELIDTNSHLKNVIDKKEEAEKSLQYLAYHDELTGLPNRNLLIDRVSQALKSSAREGKEVAILFLDLDRFKNINDILGHHIGDELLKEVPARLYEILRSHDTVSRNGGDEFVVVLEKLKNANEAVHVAKKIIKCLTETFNIQSHTIHIGASIGISVYPTDGDTPLILLRNADTAMYRAKQAGGNQLQFYDESMSHQLRDRLELESELHTALENNEFYMVYQPQVNCKTGETTGFESLLRWSSAKYGEIGPNRFVPVLEETGLIYDVGKWIVTEVLAFASHYDSNGVSFSINLSALQCYDSSFVVFVNDRIKNLGIDPKRIEFEITESLLLRDFNKAKVFLDELHSIGCTIALDDFGTGYTSMNYLAQLSIDVIKIDRSFVKNIDKSINLQSIVKAIVTMSKSLNMTNIFEGVETEAELNEILKMDGDIIQGYLFSKPLTSIDTQEWFAKEKVRKLKQTGT